MTEQEKQKYYGNEAFETIYEKTKKEYVPQQMSYTPLDEKTLTERISAVLRPVYDKAIAAIFQRNRHADAELDADAISRGMGSSTFVTDVKRRQDSAAADDARELEDEYIRARENTEEVKAEYEAYREEINGKQDALRAEKKTA